MKFTFDNNVNVVLTPYSDNYGSCFEESCVCYPVLGDWEIVIGFEVPDTWETDNSDPRDWRINYLGTYQLPVGGGSDVCDWADTNPNMADPDYKHYLGTQTLRTILPDKGLYVKHVFEYLRLRDRRDVLAQNAWAIGERMSEIEFQLEDPTHEQSRIDSWEGELASLKDELEKANAEHKVAGDALEAHVGKDPTFDITD